MISARTRMMAAGAGSAAILLGAMGFEFIGGLSPCPLCLYQRWPHAAAAILALLGLTVLWRHARVVAALGMLAPLTSAGIGLYHFGIERQFWRGPDSCTSGDITGLSTDQLMAQIMGAPLVRCDEIQWEMLGLTLAGWNAVISLALAALWLSCVLRPQAR